MRAKQALHSKTALVEVQGVAVLTSGDVLKRKKAGKHQAPLRRNVAKESEVGEGALASCLELVAELCPSLAVDQDALAQSDPRPYQVCYLPPTRHKQDQTSVMTLSRASTCCVCIQSCSDRIKHVKYDQNTNHPHAIRYYAVLLPEAKTQTRRRCPQSEAWPATFDTGQTFVARST